MTQNKKLIFLTTLVSVFFVAVLYLLYLLNLKNTSPVASTLHPQATGSFILPSISPSTIPAVEIPSNWKTYENTRLGFSFRHPSDWTIRGFPGDQENFNNTDTTYTRFVVSAFDNSLSLDVRSSLSDQATDPCLSPVGQATTEKLDGINFQKTIFLSSCKNNDTKSIAYSSTAKSLVFTFDFNKYNSLIAEQTINQILSTFKFTSSLNDTISKWKTYSNESAGITFKYPQNLTLSENNNNVALSSGSYQTSIYLLPAMLNGTLQEGVEHTDFCPSGVTDGITAGPIPNSLRCNFTKSHYQGVEIRFLNDHQNRIYRASINAINPNDPIPQIEVDRLTQILSTFKFTEPKSEVPAKVAQLFNSVNAYFKSNIIPTCAEGSCTLDLTKVNKTKGLIDSIFIKQFKMEFGPGGGARGGASSDEFVNKDLDCYYNNGYRGDGGPETWVEENSYSTLTCSQR